MFQYQNAYADKRYAKWKNDSKNIPIKYIYNGVNYSGFPFELKVEKVDTAPEKETITRVFSVDKNFEITAIFKPCFLSSQSSSLIPSYASVLSK